MNIGSMTKDGAVHDLGSSSRNIMRIPVTYKGRGTKDQIIEFAHRDLVGMKILSEGVEVKDDGELIYSAVVESENGIPGSFKSGKSNLILPESVVRKSDKIISVCSFGDIDLNVNVCAFGDV